MSVAIIEAITFPRIPNRIFTALDPSRPGRRHVRSIMPQDLMRRQAARPLVEAHQLVSFLSNQQAKWLDEAMR
jgi:hypothetical protein